MQTLLTETNKACYTARAQRNKRLGRRALADF